MPKTTRKKYHSPESLFIMPDQMAFFANQTVELDPALEAQRRKASAELHRIADHHLAEYRRVKVALKSLGSNGSKPNDNDISSGKAHRKRPWRLRSNSNMDKIASMLESAGRKGVSELEMVESLRSMGRLTTATQPHRSVHWTVSELRLRTMNAVRKDATDGVRWYAYGNFNEWRGPAA